MIEYLIQEGKQQNYIAVKFDCDKLTISRYEVNLLLILIEKY